MNNVFIIGYGNTLRGDDAAGVHAASLIAQHHPEVACICMHQLMPELAEQIAECDTVFFMDADVNAAQPTARLIVPRVEVDQPRTHFISPESLLSLCQQLYKRMPLKAYVIGIPASDFEFNENLSERTTRAVNECVKMVEHLMKM